ncbi:AAA family ATPase [Marinactinospora rubrisoli]|uniref:AAA family ATPase n=1 Tax=Marinactinospora rubrisoli TaxID=2715399 RepID=A0ABW2KHD8_9ACTN
MNPLICDACGGRTDRPAVDPGASVVVCPDCGTRRPFRRLPLYCVTGPSGTGKSTVARRLADRLADRYVILEQDVLWVAGLRDPAEDHRAFRSTWLRMIAMLHQSGRPAVLCGTVAPPEFERLPERALFQDVHYLALVCEPGELARRLRSRPAWREWTEPRIAEMLRYNEWIRTAAHTMDPPMTLLDTTRAALPATVDAVCGWIAATADRGIDPAAERPMNEVCGE